MGSIAYNTDRVHGRNTPDIRQINAITDSRFEKDILCMLEPGLSDVLRKVDKIVIETIEEVRLRANKPVMISNFQNDWFVGKDGRLSLKPYTPFIATQEQIIRTFELMSENSIYAFQEDIRNGFITIKGGHRVGISGKVVYEGQQIKNIKDLSSINIRVAKQFAGCASSLMKHIINTGTVFNTLLVSPPQCGKTTLLRDIARQISNGIPELFLKGLKVGIVDERSEIAACYRGIPQNDVGIRTDVLDGCPKAIGLQLMIRSMSPDVLVTDEIGCEGDRDAIMGVMNAGVRIVASAHGYNVSDLKSRREVLKLLEDKVFEKYIVLSNKNGPGTIVEITDGKTTG